MGTLRRAKTVHLRSSHDSNRRCQAHHEYYCSDRRNSSPCSSETSLTTFSDRTTTQRPSYVSPSRKNRSKTAVLPFHSHHRHTHSAGAVYTENQLADLQRIKQYVRDLQIEISTLRHQQNGRKVCEDCQYNRRRHANTKEQIKQLKQQNSELSLALEDANGVIAEIQDENMALSQATKILKKKTEKLLRLMQKRDAMREPPAKPCKHRRNKPAFDEEDNQKTVETKPNEDREADVVAQKWERFRQEMAQMKDGGFQGGFRQGKPEGPIKPQGQNGGDRRDNGEPQNVPRVQHPRTPDAVQLMQSKGQRQDGGYRNPPKQSNGPPRQTESERTFADGPSGRQQEYPQGSTRRQPAPQKKKVMSATELDKWSRYYASKQAGNQRRQSRTQNYLAGYNIPQQQKEPERALSAEERLERFRMKKSQNTGQARTGEQGNGYGPGKAGYNQDDNQGRQNEPSVEGTEQDSQAEAHVELAESHNSGESSGQEAEFQSDMHDQYDIKDVDLECVDGPLRDIICQIDSLAHDEDR